MFKFESERSSKPSAFVFRVQANARNHLRPAEAAESEPHQKATHTDLYQRYEHRCLVSFGPKVLVFLFLKEDDSEDDSTYQASGAEGESDGEDDREMGCSQESVIARMQELSLRPEPTLPDQESESDSDAPPPLEAPASQDEDESESEHELLPLQDEGPRPCKELPMTQATESSESESDSDKAPQRAW